ncbi:MAG: glycosyltransferase family 2 protein [Dehalococcoidia bacterium]
MHNVSRLVAPTTGEAVSQLRVDQKSREHSRFSIAICTRGDDLPSLLRALRSAESVRGCCDEIIVVDQGRSDGLLPQSHAVPGRDLVHVKHEQQGVSRARNLALRLARNEVVVFTDDDCEFTRGAASELAGAFSDAACAMAFGTVYAQESVSAEGFIPTYSPPRESMLRGKRAKLRDGGIGAAMACRKSAILALGGFDERFGPGSDQWLSCEEGELAFRVLKAGYAIAHRPDARIEHHGRRDWESAGTYTTATFKGIGAAYGMHAWHGDRAAMLLVGQQALQAGGQVIRSITELRRPTGIKRFFGLSYGALTAMRTRPLQAAPVPGMPE